MKPPSKGRLLASSLGRLSTLTPLLVGVIFLSGVSNLSCTTWPPSNRIDARTTSFSHSEAFSGESTFEAEVELTSGILEIQAGSHEDLFALELEYNEMAFDPSVDFVRDDKKARLRFGLSGEARSFRRVGRTRLNLQFSPSAALALEAKTGVGESLIDLTGLRLQSLRLENGIGETKLSMLSSNPGQCERVLVRSGVGALEVIGLGNFGFQTFQFQGGVGASTLDFSGSWERIGEIEIEVGVGGVELRIPRSLGVELRTSRSFLSSVNLNGFNRKNDTYYSENLERVSQVLRMRVRTGIGDLTVRWL